MAKKEVGIRLSLKDGDTVKRALQTLGKDGQKALKRIERASKPASKGLLAIRTFARGAQSEMQAFGARLGLVGQSLSSLGPGGLVAAAGVGALVLGLGAAMRAARGALTELDALDDAATQANFGIERLQELRAAADETGVGARFLDDGLRRMTRRIGEFANSGAGPAAKALKALKIEVFDTSGALRSSDAIFDQIIKKMEGVESQAQRSAFAAQLFGDDAGPRMTLLLNQGSDGIERLTQKAREMGLVLDESIVKNASKVNDELIILEKVISTQLSSALVTLGPLLVDTASFFAEAARAAAFFADSWRDSSDAIDRLVANPNLDDFLRVIGVRWRDRGAPIAPEDDSDLIVDPSEYVKPLRLGTIRNNRVRPLDKPAGGGAAAGDDEQKRLERLAATYREKITPAVEKFAATLRDLEAAKRAGLLTDAEFAASTAKAREEFAQIETAARKAGLAISTDFRSGLTRGFAAVAEDAGNAAKQIETAVTGAFGKFEDAIVKATQTGKLEFTDLVTSIQADLTRLLVRQAITGPIANAFGGGGGGGFLASLFAQTGHSGAVVGSGITGRTVPATAFAGAPRFHGGGFPGLQPGEVPFIAKKGEGVFTKEQMAAMGSGQTVVTINNFTGEPVEERRSRSGNVDQVEIIVGAMGEAAGQGRLDPVFGARFGARAKMVSR